MTAAAGDRAPGDVLPRPASTVVLARDGTAGIEVLMLERSPKSSFMASAVVFPGGGLDGSDAAGLLARRCTGLDDAGASDRLGLETGGLAWFVAAIRECFEEAGVLLASEAGGRPVSFSHDAVDGLAAARRALNAGEITFADLCEREDLLLDVGGLRYFSHWLTPRGFAKRFDTRFFVAKMPDGQEPMHDDGEAVAQLFLRPSEAIARYEERRLAIFPPTRLTLEAVAAHASVAELLESADSLGEVPLIEPAVIPGSDPMEVLLPGDAGYEDLVARSLR